MGFQRVIHDQVTKHNIAHAHLDNFTQHPFIINRLPKAYSSGKDNSASQEAERDMCELDSGMKLANYRLGLFIIGQNKPHLQTQSQGTERYAYL